MMKEISNDSINRYIQCLNKIYEDGIMSEADLKKYIMKDAGLIKYGDRIMVDRKTIKRTIEKLVNNKLVKCKDHEVMLYKDGKSALYKKRIIYSMDI